MEAEQIMRARIATAALLIALPASAFAAKKPVTKEETVVVKTTIEAIDKDARTVTLKGKDGGMETLYAGPEIKRFDELKVGDQVTFRYTESVAVNIRKPGEPGSPKPSAEPAVEHSSGAKPGGKAVQQDMATVIIKAIDMNVPSVTVQSEDGRTMSFKVKDKGLLKKAAVGDKVEILYKTAVIVSVE